MILSDIYRFKVLKTGIDVNLPGLFFRVEIAFCDSLSAINVSNLINSNLPYLYLSL